jgi:hypothetical protein
MIGDFIGAGGFVSEEFFHEFGIHAPFGSAAIAGGDRRFKIGENQVPIPIDRVFFSYNHFHNAILVTDADGRTEEDNFHRFTFGIEKTLCGGAASIEFRAPFGHGLDSTQSGEPGASLMGTELGNVVLVAKTYLLRSCCWALTGGVAVTFPTADDGRYLDDEGFLVAEIDNDSYHLQPFLGALWTPTDRLFFEAFAAADFDTNGYDVSVSDAFFRNGRGAMEQVGTYNDQSLLILDAKVGYWFHCHGHSCHHWITAIAPTVEVHYTSTMQDSDQIFVEGELFLSDPLNRWSNLNLTAGLQFLMGNDSILTVYGVAPLKDDEDDATGVSSNFEWELGAQYNCYF